MKKKIIAAILITCSLIFFPTLFMLGFNMIVKGFKSSSFINFCQSLLIWYGTMLVLLPYIALFRVKK